ncbi:hypothetical protein SAMN02745857_03277 [Andreprevotia lacus DSM 23236]|jgi:hypothetical protein|uniref:Uncharacterized protein n=1 Tax=Andreprevotia lacus DSM 23236 TaxID=1121001 RepID=A0A1W1XX85_9NEIS|nr:hypothetical protein [Andreprevotia lacus]SMC28475.1 hypothetical protein SAMN02745857_03277 [Andreprevotia lacus DSM 23236]
MTPFFDIARGEIHLKQGLSLRAGLTSQQLAQAGLAFIREFDMQTGWCFKTASAHTQSGQAIQLSLGFEHDHLKRLSFGFVNDPSLDGNALHKAHVDFLVHELGTPNSQNDRQSIYRFVWGEITAEQDPRGGGSYVIVSWA